MLRYFWNRRRQEGFTLIELLVVVAIIALLAAFAVPRLFEAINKSKGSQGKADLQTITASLERYYMDNSAYPHGAADADVEDALRGEYLKTQTTFENGFGKSYILVTNSTGGYYVFIDVANQADNSNITLTCGPAASPHTQAITTDDVGIVLVTSATITADDVNVGCSITAGMTEGNEATVITN